MITVQALPEPYRRQAITNVSRLVAAHGTLLVVAAVHDDAIPVHPTGPWPLTRDDVEALTVDGLTAVQIDQVTLPRADQMRWLAEFRRR